MNVLVYLYYPYFKDHLAGGLQFVMSSLIQEISTMDKDIHFKIVCPRSDSFVIENDPDIFPVLHDFEVDGLQPEEIKEDIVLLEKLANEADVIWLSDRNYPIVTKTPKVLSLFTLGYERALKSFFETDWTEIVYISSYLENKFQCCIREGQVTNVLPFYCTPEFTRKDRNKSFQRLKKYFDADTSFKYLVFPHRCDPVKGHIYAIEVLKELIKKDDSYRLLISMPSTSRLRDQTDENEYFQSLLSIIDKNNLNDRVIFHPWIAHEDLPYYFSIGEYALFLSSLTETFGVTLLNSICCGTPVISYGSGALSEIIPSGRGHRVLPYAEIDAIVNCILQNKEKEKVWMDTQFALQIYKKEPIIEKYCELFHRISKL